jgi:hypothetical protein
MSRISIEPKNDAGTWYCSGGNNFVDIGIEVGQQYTSKFKLNSIRIVHTEIGKDVRFFKVLHGQTILETVFFNKKTKKFYEHKTGESCPQSDRDIMVQAGRGGVQKRVHGSNKGGSFVPDFLSGTA